MSTLATPPRAPTIEERLRSLNATAEAGRAGGAVTAVPPLVERAAPATSEFVPRECESFEAMGVPEALVEALIHKHLLAVGANTCRGMARDLSIPGKPTLELLNAMKNRQLVVYKGSASMGDFEYTLTESGRQRALRYVEECSYCGPAPVPLAAYVASVAAQTLSKEHPQEAQLREAFGDLLINADMFSRLGPAVNSGRGLFLYGFPGNGKTSIAERITRCFGSALWIPRALFVEGQIVLLYDPQNHELAEGGAPSVKGPGLDTRWVRIKRPTIVVGGELTMSSLELQFNAVSKVTEAPLQLRSNGGTLVIDDFGRQRMSPFELLNRWIIPLEKRYDFLTLQNGKKIQVPFDQLIIFSTNLEPKQLVDDAFLRRIPYKINVVDPTEAEFRSLMGLMAGKLGVPISDAAVDHLVSAHYRTPGRCFRACHPRDLLLQIVNQSRYRGCSPVMSPQAFDDACANYFAVM